MTVDRDTGFRHLSAWHIAHATKKAKGRISGESEQDCGKEEQMRERRTGRPDFCKDKGASSGGAWDSTGFGQLGPN